MTITSERPKAPKSWAAELDDRVVVITGAAAGIGAAVARRLAGPGPRLFLLDRDEYRTEALAEELRTAGTEATAVLVDLRDQEALERTCAALDLDGRELVVVNCASGLSKLSLDDVTLGEWQSQYEVNVIAPATIVRTLTRSAEKGGSIVNISSEAAFRARGSAIAYDTAKAAVLALTRSMAVALAGKRIRVNCVAPGWTITERHVGYGEDAEARRIELEHAAVPAILGRPAVPDEIAGVICFLASDDASFIDGSTIHVDGGLSIH